MNRQKIPMSKTRKIYFMRLVGRCVVFLAVLFLYFFGKETFLVAESGKFFSSFSVLHILWGIWILDMLLQLIPVKAHISIGSQKQFSSMFRPIREKINGKNLKKFLWNTTRSAYFVMLLWIGVNSVIGVLYCAGILDTGAVVCITTFFYVCDLICVLIWCPFRLIMKNKCCTTCRIFNWDHLMMFAPLIMVPSFFARTLVTFALLDFLVWEICVFTYPERFWESSNQSLLCSECTDKLCTQYCRKLRKREN